MANNSTGQNLDEDILQCRADIERLRETILKHSRNRISRQDSDENEDYSADSPNANKKNIITVSKIENLEVEKPDESDSEDNVRMARQAIDKMREQIRKNKEGIGSQNAGKSQENINKEEPNEIEEDEAVTQIGQKTDDKPDSQSVEEYQVTEIKTEEESIDIPSFEEVIEKHSQLQHEAKRKEDESLAWLGDAELLDNSQEDDYSPPLLESDGFNIEEIENWAQTAEMITAEHNTIKTQKDSEQEHEEETVQAETPKAQEQKSSEPENTSGNEIPQFDLSRQSMAARRNKVSRTRRSPKRESSNNEQKDTTPKVDKVARTVNEILANVPTPAEANEPPKTAAAETDVGAQPGAEIVTELETENDTKIQTIEQTGTKTTAQAEAKPKPEQKTNIENTTKIESIEHSGQCEHLQSNEIANKISLGCSRILDELKDQYIEDTVISDIVERDIAEYFANQPNEATAA